MIDPRQLIRAALSILGRGEVPGGKERASLSLNSLTQKAQFPTVAEYDVIEPDRAKKAYQKLVVDPNKAYFDRGNGLSSTVLSSDNNGYEVNKLRMAPHAMGRNKPDKPVNNITFGVTNKEGVIDYNRRNAVTELGPKGSRQRFYQDYDNNLRRNELKAMLGRMLDDIRPGSYLSVAPYDSDKGGRARMKLYERATNRALLFDNKGRGDSQRVGRNTWKNKDGELRTFDPKDFKKALKKMTEGRTIRTLLRMTPFARRIPLINALMTGGDIGQHMVDTYDKNTSVSGRGGGRSALND